MRKFLRWWILNNVAGATVTTDAYGNLLVTKGPDMASFMPSRTVTAKISGP